jgi:hypothetical protein
MPCALQIGPQIRVIENLPVVDDLKPPGFAGHWLTSGGREIDDAKPAMPKCRMGIQVESIGIGAAMCDPASHPA